MKLSEWLGIYAPEAKEPFLRALNGKAEKDVRNVRSGLYQFKYNKTVEGKQYWKELFEAIDKFIKNKERANNYFRGTEGEGNTNRSLY